MILAGDVKSASLVGDATNKQQVEGGLSMQYGTNGRSAYEVAVALGFEGTEEEWLESLHGNGIKEITNVDEIRFIPVGEGIAKEKKFTVITVILDDGTEKVFEIGHGMNGDNGENGEDGIDGVGIKEIYTTKGEIRDGETDEVVQSFTTVDIELTDGERKRFNVMDGKDAKEEKFKCNAIITEHSGETILTTDSANAPLVDMTPYGKSTQDGTPTIENLIEVVSHGDKGSMEYGLYGLNLCPPITTKYVEDGITYDFKDGYVTVTGTSEAFTNTSSVKVLLPIIKGTFVIPKKQNNVTVNVRITASDGTKSYVNGTYTLDGTEKEVTMYFQVGSAGLTVNEKIPLMCNYGTELFSYTPYVEKQPLTILTPNGLRGIPIGTTIPDVIKNSEIHMRGVWFDKVEQRYYISDTREYVRGKDVQRILKYTFSNVPLSSIVGTPSISNGYTEGCIQTNIKQFGNRGLCTHFKYITSGNKQRFANYSSYVYFVLDGEYTKEEFKTKLDEISPTIYVILETPIETDIPSEEMAQYNALMMNYPNTTILNDEGAYTEVEYVADTKRYIDNKFKELAVAMISQ